MKAFFSSLLLFGFILVVKSTPVHHSPSRSGVVIGDNNRTVCYGELGCFSTGGAFFHPTKRPINNLPDSRESINTKFLLYTPGNKNDPDNLLWSSTIEDLKKTHFNNKLETKFITHGFLDTQFFGKWMRLMKDEFFKLDDYNVVIVDWQGGNSLPYTQATANTRVVGAEVALFIGKLQKAFGVDPRNMHILGHSLGGQITGYVGKRLNRLGRITAFDPAEPYFQGLPTEVRVDSTDAEFVEIIHSDGASFITKIGLGMIDPVGHVDFYPNGGIEQPDCDIGSSISNIITEGLVETVRNVVACKHHRSIYYYHEAINGKCLQIGYQCPNYELFQKGKCNSCGNDGSKCAIVGPRVTDYKPHKRNDAHPKFYYNTNGKKNYCLPHYSVVIKMKADSKAKDVKGTFYVTLNGENGQAEIKANKDTETFYAGAEYTFLVTDSKNLGKIKNIGVRWKKSGLFGSSEAYVQYVEVYPMSLQVTTATTRPSVTVKGCFNSPLKSNTVALGVKC